MKKIALLLLAASLFVFNSCTKTGPQGPAGPQGNANVKGSNPFDVTAWSYDAIDKVYYASFNDPDITTAVADRGVVECFLYYPSDATWRPLPDIVNGTQFFFRFSQGGFEIYYGNVDGTTPAALTGSYRFRVVVIAPSNKQAHPNTNWKNYDEAVKALHEDAQATATKL